MAQVFRDIATANLEGRGAAILSYVLPHGRDFSAKGNGSVSLSDGETVSSHGRCRKCGQKVAEIINIKGKGELHVMEQPCTRLVLGINDGAREANEKESGKNISFAHGDSYYFCSEHKCGGWAWPERMAESIPEIREGVWRRWSPIHDCGKRAINGKGCFITLTEFLLNSIGRHFNFQTDFRDYVWILNETEIVDKMILESHLA